MKSRTLKYEDRADINASLSRLVMPVTPSEYQHEMLTLGQYLAEKLSNRLKDEETYCVASTAEDADFLAKGVIDGLLASVADVKLACFWNHHTTPVKGGESTAPIVRKFFEKGATDCQNLIIVKSVISGACVVKTNLTDLIQKMNPNRIFVVSPVMHVDAKMKLSREFPPEISNKFDFEYFATDAERDALTNEVKPGIGGDVYILLGLSSQEHKNSFLPELVKSKIF